MPRAKGVMKMRSIELSAARMAALALRPEQPAAQPTPEQPAAPAAAIPAAAETPGKQSAAVTEAQLARAAALEAAAQPEETELPGQTEDEEIKSLIEMMEESSRRAKEMREKLKLPKNARRYGEAAIEAYARLRRANTDAAVSAAAGYARRQAAQLQSALRSDSENAPRIRAAIRNLQAAAGHAARKKRELAEERSADRRAKRAAEEQQKGKAARIRAEQNRRKAARFMRETGNIRGAVLSHVQQEYLAHERAEAAGRAEAVLGAAAPAVPAAVPAAEPAPAPETV